MGLSARGVVVVVTANRGQPYRLQASSHHGLFTTNPDLIMVRLYCLVALLFLTANSSSPAAQQPPSAARSPLSSAAAQTPVFDGAVRSAVIDSLSARLVRSYISE